MKIRYILVLLIPVLLLVSCSKKAEDDYISSIDELIPLEHSNMETLDYQIVILYKEPGDNNIAKLKLLKSEVVSGKTVSDRVDVIELSTDVNPEEVLKIIQANENVEAASFESTASSDL